MNLRFMMRGLGKHNIVFLILSLSWSLTFCGPTQLPEAANKGIKKESEDDSLEDLKDFFEEYYDLVSTDRKGRDYDELGEEEEEDEFEVYVLCRHKMHHSRLPPSR